MSKETTIKKKNCYDFFWGGGGYEMVKAYKNKSDFFFFF